MCLVGLILEVKILHMFAYVEQGGPCVFFFIGGGPCGCALICPSSVSTHHLDHIRPLPTKETYKKRRQFSPIFAFGENELRAALY